MGFERARKAAQRMSHTSKAAIEGLGSRIGIKGFNLEHSLVCGQVFRWRQNKGWWYRAIGKGVVKVRQAVNSLEFVGTEGANWNDVLSSYFRLDDNLEEILYEINKDDFISQAIRKYRGLRLIRQDPWECIISYIIATNSNIPQIERNLENLSRSFGKRIIFDGMGFYTFPTAEVLARADISKLRACRVGYRAEFIKATAQSLVRGGSIFQSLNSLPYESAKELLLEKLNQRKVFKGIGPKVADCILLFSLDKLEAFPMDIWILRTVLEKYSHLFEKAYLSALSLNLSKGSLGVRDYYIVSQRMREHFGRFAGYAQEYLYHFARRG